MKLLLDENLSDRLLARLVDVFPGSCHVKELGLIEADDLEIWERARDLGLVIVTKDRDFQQLCVLHGAPPKVVWLRIGNRSTPQVLELLRSNASTLRTFGDDPKTSLLIVAAEDAAC